jgi:endonuclease YncB( thermonuclease family)
MPARLLLLSLVLVPALLAAQAAGGASDAQRGDVVARVTDGDTLRLADGRRVRLLQVDSPEHGECYGREARDALLALAPIGARVGLQVDPRLDRTDRFGRLLRYVRRGSTNVNLELVRRGAAAPYFFGGERGRYASRLLAAAEAAKRARRGLWGASPRTVLDPDRALDTGRCDGGSSTVPLVPPSSRCDPNYAGCVPPYPPDLDCEDIRDRGLAPVRVTGSDPHRLDGDGDGFGCE